MPAVSTVSPCFEQLEPSRAKLAEGELQHRRQPGRYDNSKPPEFECWSHAMAAGDFEQAWQLNDAFGQHWPSAHCLWNGGSLRDADVTVRSLHGLGDAVQMLRYASRLGAQARRVCFQVPASLVPLARHFFGVTEVVSFGTEAVRIPGTPYVELETMELPYLFRTSRNGLPIASNYLMLPESIKAACDARMGAVSKRRIGFVWTGGAWDRERWLPLDLIKPLLQDRDIEGWNLQGGEASTEAAGLPTRSVSELGDAGLVILAAAIANLDLLLTVDTLAAHLGGALGVPTWLMLKHKADWRWMRGRIDSPWYPSMRLFRQPTRGDWSGVVSAVRRALDSSLVPGSEQAAPDACSAYSRGHLIHSALGRDVCHALAETQEQM